MEWTARGPAFRKTALSAEDSLDEVAELAATAGAAVVERALQSRPSPEAATLIGRGKVEELAASAAASRADVVIFDHDLTPTQQRNLGYAGACTRAQLIGASSAQGDGDVFTDIGAGLKGSAAERTVQQFFAVEIGAVGNR